MKHEATVGREKLWDAVFPGLVPASPLIAEAVPANGFELEGNRLVPSELGHTDTDDTTALWVPSLELVLAGDSVYNGVHQYVLESSEEGFASWYAALDTLAALKPKFVVAGHKAPAPPIIRTASKKLVPTLGRGAPSRDGIQPGGVLQGHHAPLPLPDESGARLVRHSRTFEAHPLEPGAKHFLDSFHLPTR